MRFRLTIAAAGIALTAALIVVAVAMRTSEPALALTPTPSWTSTPTRTPTPTPTPLVANYTFTNTTGADADALDIVAGTSLSLTVTSNAPGCSAPTLLPPVTIGQGSFFAGTVGTIFYPIKLYRVRWDSACVDDSESVSVQFTYGSHILNRIFFEDVTVVGTFFDSSIATLTPTPSPTTTPTLTPTEEPVPFVALSIDCDPTTAGIQSICSIPNGVTSLTVDLILTNNSVAEGLGALEFFVNNPNTTRLKAAVVPCSGAALDCNPDLDQSSLTGTNWLCTPPSPSPDSSAAAGDQSKLGCFIPTADAPLVASGASVRVARFTYDVLAGSGPVTIPLTLRDVSLYTEGYGEFMSCAPFQVVAGVCNDASVTLEDGPTVTATTTPSVTPDAPPTSTPPPAATPVASSPITPPPTGPYFAVDCDPAPGIQDACTYSTDAGAIDVAVVFVLQDTPASMICCMEFRLRNPDTSRLDPPAVPDPLPAFDSNPDANQALLPSSNSYCNPPAPDNDTGADGPGTSVSFLGCYTGMPSSPVQAAGSAIVIGTVRYNIPAAAQSGTVPLTLTNTSMYSAPGFDELGSCAPDIDVDATCIPAFITLVDPPPSVEKIPDGNENNTDLTIPAANLWICDAPGSCFGPGEGDLRVVEHASNVHSDTDADNIPDGSDSCICTGLGPDNTIGTADDTNPVAPPNTDLGLGAYEFSVEYDNFVIQSVNPCDIVFGTGSPPGAGANRGPVDELDSSAVNPDCFGDPGPAAPGSCAMSLILENIIHFGCASGGQNLGPMGDMDLASLLLIPHPDLSNDIFPGNNNGVLTVLKDNGCELVDTLGHPVHGSVNGGLTPSCRDLAVTVRILEGDIDLDCDVDLTDAQAIAARYGAFFGGLLYSKWYDLEPEFHDLDIDIKDVQKVFGRQGSTCDTPIPAQPPLGPPTAFQD